MLLPMEPAWAKDRATLPFLLTAVRSQSPVLRQAGTVGLQHSLSVDALSELFAHPEAAIRHAALLSIREKDPDRFEQLLPQALADASEAV